MFWISRSKSTVSGGATVLTNNQSEIVASLNRIGYDNIDVKVFLFSLNVPKRIRFYSAHFKIDAFKYFGTLPGDEYSLLLDSDIVCTHDFSPEYYALLEERIPTTYFFDAVGGKICKIIAVRRNFTIRKVA